MLSRPAGALEAGLLLELRSYGQAAAEPVGAANPTRAGPLCSGEQVGGSLAEADPAESAGLKCLKGVKHLVFWSFLL